jgi:heat shock protein beta
LAAGLDTDCNANGVPDSCDADSGSDCNNNGTPDACDLADGTAADCNLNGVPDSCEPDCDRDGTPDACEIAGGATDCDGNGVPDSCQADCDGDGVLDFCEIASGATDCDADGIPDACEIAAAQTLDFNNDGTLDACQPAMQFAGLQLEIQPIVGRGTDDLFPAGAVCYRLYARVSADAASAVGVYGNSQYPMVVSAAGGFWQSPFGGDLANEVGCNDTSALPSYRYDSWFTIGKDCALGNAVQNTGLDFTGFNSGSGINDADGIVFVAPGSPQAAGGAARRVLLAQFTTTRPVFPTGTVNVVGRSNGGSGPENAWLALGQQIPMPALVDCNGNGEHDAFDIAKGVVLDCDQSGVPDTCEHPSAVTDCNSNGISDLCDCYSGFSSDINTNNVPDECECTGDIDANGVVDVDDIIWVLVSWGADGSSEADVNSDGIVNGADLAIVLQGWGQCS